jgi:zinc protease
VTDPLRGELGGLPTWHSGPHSELPFLAALVFRVGYCDETLRTRGLTHLVEHLALPDHHRPGLTLNGVVDQTSTLFWFSGEREESLAELRATLAALADLPLDRVEAERRVLYAEQGQRYRGVVPLLLSLRFGASPHGLSNYDELALHWAAPDDLAAWARHAFTRDNAALYFAGEPPAELDVALPPGGRLTPPEPEPIDYVAYPSVFRGGPPGSVAASFVGRRSHELMAVLRVLELRLRDTLRFRHGVTYDVGWDYQVLTAELAHVVLWADALDENVERARNVLLTVVDDLAFTGPTQEELERDLALVAESLDEPLGTAGRLWGIAHDELLGVPHEPREELLARRGAVTSASAGQALAAAAGTMLLCLPDETPLPRGRFTPYPLESPASVAGRRFRRRRRLLERSPAGIERGLVVGDEGVCLVTESWRTSIRFDACEALLRVGEGRGLWSRDGFYVWVDPTIWRHGEDAVRTIDERVPSERVVDVLPEEPPFADAHLARGADALAEGKLDEAVQELRLGLEAAPDDASAWALLAAAQQQALEPAAALEAAARALGLDPALMLALGTKAQALNALGRVEEAAQAAREALRLDPADLGALSDYARIAADARLDVEGATRAAERAVELFPDVGTAWNALADARAAAGDVAGADAAYARAVELEPKDATSHHNLGYHLLATGRPREAVSRLKRASRLDPQLALPWTLLPAAFALSGRRGAAERTREAVAQATRDALRERLDSAPDDVAALAGLVAPLLVLGRPDEARATAESLAAAARSQGEVDGLLRAAGACFDLGDDERGRQLFAEARSLAPAAAAQHDDLAFVALLAGDPDAAAAGAAALASPRHSLADEAAGYAALARGEAAVAAECFARALEVLPLRCCSHAWRGVASHRAGGDPEEARALLERASVLCSAGGRHCCSVRALARELDGD